jgi:hypothetical protein
MKSGVASCMMNVTVTRSLVVGRREEHFDASEHAHHRDAHPYARAQQNKMAESRGGFGLEAMDDPAEGTRTDAGRSATDEHRTMRARVYSSAHARNAHASMRICMCAVQRVFDRASMVACTRG